MPEQELNHLTIAETIEFLQLCNLALKPGGRIIVYAMNGRTPSSARRMSRITSITSTT